MQSTYILLNLPWSINVLIQVFIFLVAKRILTRVVEFIGKVNAILNILGKIDLKFFDNTRAMYFKLISTSDTIFLTTEFFATVILELRHPSNTEYKYKITYTIFSAICQFDIVLSNMVIDQKQKQ